MRILIVDDDNNILYSRGDFQNPGAIYDWDECEEFSVNDLKNSDTEINCDVQLLSGSFYHRNKTIPRNIKAIRKKVAKEKFHRPHICMTGEQSNMLQKLYRGVDYLVTSTRGATRGREEMAMMAYNIAMRCLTLNRKLFLLECSKYYSLSTANKLLDLVTGNDITDGEMINLLKYYSDRFREACGYEVVYKVHLGEIIRYGSKESEIVSISFASKAIVDLFKENTHILYVDACHTSDHGSILLAVFEDANHKVQPLGFQISPTENQASWDMFLMTLKEAGVDFDDLVINSDRHEGLLNAIATVFPTAENVSCFVHVERNIQDKWVKTYGVLAEEKKSVVEDFNKYMNFLNCARVSITEEECNGYLKQMELIEMSYSHSDECSVLEYIKEIPSIFMYKWRYNHLMEVTSNPVEICMKELKDERYSLNSCRNEIMFNKFRYLIRWMYDCVEVRFRALNSDMRHSYRESFKVPCEWVEVYIKRMASYYETYRTDFKVKDANQNRDVTTPRLNLFDVLDCGLNAIFRVNLRDMKCSCHEPHWRHTPCVHIIAVLHERCEFSRVWDGVGSEYYQDNVKKTCRYLTAEERDILDEIILPSNPMVVPPDKESIKLRTVRGRTSSNARRKFSRGERTEMLPVC